MEKDNEVKGSGNSYTTHFRQNDPRLGRWLTVDPRSTEMAWQSSYCSMDNNPIVNTDILGDKVDPTALKESDKDAYSTLKSDLEGSTGLNLTENADGTWGYETKKVLGLFNVAVKSKGASGIARRTLKRSINSSETVSIVKTTGVTEYRNNTIYLNTDNIDAMMQSGSSGLDQRTMGYAMTFFHENFHGTTGLDDEGYRYNEKLNPLQNALLKKGKSKLNGTDDGLYTGPIVNRTNKIRKQLGYPMRMNYPALVVSDANGVEMGYFAFTEMGMILIKAMGEQKTFKDSEGNEVRYDINNYPKLPFIKINPEKVHAH